MIFTHPFVQEQAEFLPLSARERQIRLQCALTVRYNLVTFPLAQNFCAKKILM